jgi:hypothetical protein
MLTRMDFGIYGLHWQDDPEAVARQARTAEDAGIESIWVGTSKLGPGIDIRGSGGYLIGPGSRSQRGVYRLRTTQTTAIADVPSELLALLTPPERPARPPRHPWRGDSDGRLAGLLNAVESAKEGTRNGTLYWAAREVAQALAAGVHPGGFSERELHSMLVDAAEHCELDFAEADRTVDSAFRHELGGSR